MQADVPPALVRPAPTVSAFAPRTDTTYRYRTEQRRDDAGHHRHFILDRTVAFSREDDGYAATLTVVAASDVQPAYTEGMFATMQSAFRDRPIRFHLDRSGAVRSVDDQAILWKMLSDTIVTTATASRPGDATRAAVAEQVVAPLRAMKPAQQLAMLASMMGAVLAPEIVTAGVQPSREVQHRGSTGQAATLLSGRERVWAAGGHMLVQERTLSGPIRSGTDAAGEMSVRLDRRIDRDTGLVRHHRQTTRTRTGDLSSLATTEITFEPITG